MTLGRQEELLAQLRELLALPSPTSTPPPFKVESGGPLLGVGPPAPSTATMDDASCGGRGRRRRGSKRDQIRDDEHEEPNTHYSCKRRRKTKQQMSKSIVTSVPDFDGYKWRKYGQKQIEGAMYPRSYYRCTRSAEQGCQAKRTVQRNGGGGGAAPKYTVVYMGEHTCTANDSLEAPVILETTAVPVIASTSNKRPRRQDDDDTTNCVSLSPMTSEGGSAWSTTTTISTGTESPAISDNDFTWSSSSSSCDCVDEYGAGGLLDVLESCWAPASAPAPAPAMALQEMGEFTGPIRSPVHVPSAGWTIDQFRMQLFNVPVCHFPAGFDLFLAS